MNDQTDSFNQKLLEVMPRLKRYAIVLAVTPESSDDLLQATLERALQKQQQWKIDTHLDRWLFTIMSSIWKNEIRSRVVRQGNGLSEDVDLLFDKSNEDKVNRTFLYEQVFKEVMVLPENQREPIILIYVEGIKYQEAADILEIPLGTLMSRLARARIALANRFDESKNNSKSSVVQFNEKGVSSNR